MLVRRMSFVLLTLSIVIGMLVIEKNHVQAESYIKELEDQWVQPVNGTITDTFGTRHGKHKGIDIAAPEGEEIVSVSDGKVTKSYYSDSYGNVVFIEHPEGYETVYAHLSKRNVNEGENVKKGQVVGIIGNTGISTGTHLHFELHQGEWTYEKEHALDPLFVFESHTAHANQEKQENKNKDKNQIQDESKKNKMNEQEAQKKVITVTKGDTLWGLSSEYDVSIKSLKEWNDLESELIYPDQKLTLYLNEDNYAIHSLDTREV
ncbi:peptidoglycan DD-metalloendopeptidase family protein [Metabacillus litoralis]|uniref:peptidoglycan DD-metalloendopeptidase family protein n=1 Tax=Metabacillus litoralis TaxID=152268 RepID=UPI00203E8B72|nr:peptidoglycan DD-metalloendopeptidase family protein [Metabacillus litoralis]MCM3413399.1 peptidoglycan DD-metalloendopeptidase family protein [Metabacillus litoralis]